MVLCKCAVYTIYSAQVQVHSTVQCIISHQYQYHIVILGCNSEGGCEFRAGHAYCTGTVLCAAKSLSLSLSLNTQNLLSLRRKAKQLGERVGASGSASA